MELVLEQDNYEAAWKILRALQELCNNAQAVEGEMERTLKERLKGMKNKQVALEWM